MSYVRLAFATDEEAAQFCKELTDTFVLGTPVVIMGSMYRVTSVMHDRTDVSMGIKQLIPFGGPALPDDDPDEDDRQDGPGQAFNSGGRD